MNVVYTRVSDEIRDPTINWSAFQRTLGRTLLPSIGFGTFRDIVRPTHGYFWNGYGYFETFQKKYRPINAPLESPAQGYSDLELTSNSQYLCEINKVPVLLCSVIFG